MTERERLVDFARAHEARGDVNAAAGAFFRAGEVEEAARVLVGAGRFVDAARVLAQSLGVPLQKVSSLSPEGRRRAQGAAVCFARGGEIKISVELFLALGDPVRAAEVLERSGDRLGAARVLQAAQAKTSKGSHHPAAQESTIEAAKRLEAAGQFEEASAAFLQLRRLSDAARCLVSATRFAEAGQLYREAGQMYEAAWCFLRAEDTGGFLDVVSRVPRNHPSYRAACVEAARVASSLGVLDFQLDSFFGHFVSQGPSSEAELEAFYLLGRLYEAHDYAESAREVYEKLELARPHFRDVESRLALLSGAIRGSAMVDEKIRREDAPFLSATKEPRSSSESLFPEFPELPPLPGTRIQFSEPPAIATPAPVEGAKGSLIADRYRIESKLGEGGMAVVYRAHDLELDEPVAIKLFQNATDDPELLQRFRQELAVCRQISHPNVVRLFDIGTHEGRRFISMELLFGSDLSGLLEEGRPMELRRAVDLLVQACAGLSAAHERGIVHRDIKPENFFVSKGDVLKVMDFGIAKRTESPGLTRAGFIAGTPTHMAPEQIQDFAKVTHLADLYALGVVAYQLFTGALPFTHDDLVPLLMMQVNEPPPTLRSQNPDLPEELEELTLRLLAKNPADRVQSCRELSIELRRIMR